MEKKSQEIRDETQEFIEATLSEVRNSLKTHLPEAEKDIHRIKPLKLSSHPALLAVTAKEEELYSENREKLPNLNTIDTAYSFLLAPDDLDGFPRNVAQWTLKERQKIINKILEQSGFNALKKHLSNQLKESLPALVLGLPVEKTAEAARELHNCLQAFKDSLSSKIQDLGQKEKELEELEKKLFTIAEKTKNKISAPYLKINTKKDAAPTEILSNWAEGLIEEAKLPKTEHIPFQQLEENIFGTPFTKVTDFCLDSLDGNKNVKSLPIDSHLLEEALQKLKESGYEKFSEEGGALDSEKDCEEIRKITDAFTSFNEAYVKSIDAFLNNALEQQGNRIYIVLQKCANELLLPLRENAKRAIEKMPDFSGLSSIFDGDVLLPSFELTENLPTSNLSFEESEQSFTTKELTESSILKNGAIGLAGTAATGALIGSIVPFFGTLAGAAVGGILGMLGGGFSGMSQEQEVTKNKKVTTIPPFDAILNALNNNEEVKAMLLSIVETYLQKVSKAFNDQLSERLNKGIDQYKNAFEEAKSYSEQNRQQKTIQLSRLNLAPLETQQKHAADWQKLVNEAF